MYKNSKHTVLFPLLLAAGVVLGLVLGVVLFIVSASLVGFVRLLSKMRKG